MRVRTRFAPSPTGELHLGNARTAALNWLFARHHGGAFVLRFEDTDVERQVREAEASILEGLDWLGLDRDEDPVRGGDFGPYRQSRRTVLYHDFAERLLEKGRAFHCYCRPGELAARREAATETGGQLRYDGRCRGLSAEEEATLRAEGRAAAVRLRVEPGPIRFEDRLRGEVEIDGAEFGDFVLLRSDGRPTYNFAVVVDDLLMEITHVIRGAGHLSNTPKQVLLYRALDAPPPEFVHVPTVLAPGGEKLSKRSGARGLSSYRAEGYHPEAVLNYLSLLSWSAESGEEVLPRDRLVRELDLDRLGASNPVLDPEKMRWLSGRHLRMEAPAELARRLVPYVEPGRWDLDERDLRALAEVVAPRIFLLSEARTEAERLFAAPDLAAPEASGALARPEAARVLRAVAEAWGKLEAWSRDTLRAGLREGARDADAGGRALYQPLRAALTGTLHGPELPDVAYVLGRERSLARLEAGERATRGGRADPARGEDGQAEAGGVRSGGEEGR